MYSFGKKYRLSDRKVIARLFEKGNILRVPGFMVRWERSHTDGIPCFQILISVSKKRVRLAHNRNRIRRRIREALRLELPAFINMLEKNQAQCALAIVWTSDEKASYTEISSKIIVLLQRLQSEYEKAVG